MLIVERLLMCTAVLFIYIFIPAVNKVNYSLIFIFTIIVTLYTV